jgi:hypothetical protein
MKVRTAQLLEHCITIGITGGILNEDLNGNHDYLIDRFVQRVMNEIDDYFTFEKD